MFAYPSIVQFFDHYKDEDQKTYTFKVSDSWRKKPVHNTMLNRHFFLCLFQNSTPKAKISFKKENRYVKKNSLRGYGFTKDGRWGENLTKNIIFTIDVSMP